MRILIASVDFPPHTDGVSAVSGALARCLADAGETVVCVGPSSPGGAEHDAVCGYRVFRFPGYGLGVLRWVPFAAAFLFACAAARPRRVYAMNIAYGGLLCRLLGPLGRFDYYLFGYGYEFEKVKRPLLRRLYRSAYLRARRVFAISGFVRERLAAFGMRPERIALVPPGIDTVRFRPMAVPEGFLAERGWGWMAGRRVVLSVGRLVLRKGFDTVIAAMPAVLRGAPDAVYALAGDGPARARLESMAASAGLGDAVRFLGRVADADLPALYNLCEVFAMPSREIPETGDVEGFGIVYLEANACGKPVVGGRSGGVGDAVEDGRTGLLADPEDPASVAAAILRLLRDPEGARMMGGRGMERARSSFAAGSFGARVAEMSA